MIEADFWKWRVFRIRLATLVFFAITSVSVLTAIALSVGFSVNLRSGFADYLAARDAQQLERFAERLVEELDALPAERQTIDRQNARRWLKLQRPPRREPPRQRRDRMDQSGPPSARPRPPEQFEARIVVLDAERKTVLGPPQPEGKRMTRSVTERPLIVDGRTVGYLQLLPRAPVPDSIDDLFVRRQIQTGGALLLGLLLLSIVPTTLIAMSAKKTVAGIQAATGDIVSGVFARRAPPSHIKEVDQVTTDINVLTDHLQTLENTRRRWLAELSHELRTPLAAIRGELETLSDGIRPLNQDAVASLSEEAERLSLLINDLHTLAVADLEAPMIERSAYELGPALQRLVADHSEAALGKRLDLLLHIETEQGFQVSWDPHRMDQVFRNLLSNSIRYTDEPGRIDVVVQSEDDTVIVRVDDTAPTVSRENLGHLFDPLFREDAARSRSTGGSGLGLSIARSIVRAHGGAITASAADAGGLSIELRLPKGHDHAR